MSLVHHAPHRTTRFKFLEKFLFNLFPRLIGGSAGASNAKQTFACSRKWLLPCKQSGLTVRGQSEICLDIFALFGCGGGRGSPVLHGFLLVGRRDGATGDKRGSSTKMAKSVMTTKIDRKDRFKRTFWANENLWLVCKGLVFVKVLEVKVASSTELALESIWVKYDW